MRIAHSDSTDLGLGNCRMKQTIGVLALALTLAGCATTNGSAPGGAVIGGFAGQPKPSGPPVGEEIILAMGTGLLGNGIGQGLSQSEKTRALEAEYRALEYQPVGEKATWGQPRGTHGEVVAAQPYRVGSQDCRQYSHTVTVKGRATTARGTACRNSDGSWTPLT